MTKKRVRTLNRQESSDDDLPSDPPANFDLGTIPAPADNLDCDMTRFVDSQTGLVVTPDSLHRMNPLYKKVMVEVSVPLSNETPNSNPISHCYQHEDSPYQQVSPDGKIAKYRQTTP
jgi:hypothetical protein